MCVKDPRKRRTYTVDIVFTSKKTVCVEAADSEEAREFAEEDIPGYFPDVELLRRGDYTVIVRD